MSEADETAKETRVISDQRKFGPAFILYSAKHDVERPNVAWQDSFDRNYPIANSCGENAIGSLA